MAEPGVSIIVATYNRAPVLREALESFLSQDYPALQVVVADDSSTDETPALLAEMERRHPMRLLTLTTDVHAPGPARNAAVGLATKPLVLIGDDDIVAPKDWVSRMVARREKLNCDALAYTYAPYSLEGRVERYHYYRVRTIMGARLQRDYTGPATFLMPREVFLRIGGFSAAPMAALEDYDLCYRLRDAGASAFYDPSIAVRHRFSNDLDAVRQRVIAPARLGLTMQRGRPRAQLLARTAAKFILSPVWSLFYYPLDLYGMSLRMEWLFFRERFGVWLRGQ